MTTKNVVQSIAKHAPKHPKPASKPAPVANRAAPRVYSYVRFSDIKQASGTSVERQTAYAESWAKAHGLALDDQLTMQDSGLSAFHQRHIEKGALGVFLRAVESGKVTPGSVLVVESLDRLSRADVDIALTQLLNIIQSDIRVVTAGDNREYSRKTVRENPTELIISITVMMRANEESATKSKRVKSALRYRCEGWLAGTYKGRVGSSASDPAWVKWNGQAFEIIPHMALPIIEMIGLYRQGHGAQRIIEILAEKGLKISVGRNAVDRVAQTLVKRSLIGERVLTVEETTYTLPGYYPPLISEIEFNEIQWLMTQRGRRKGKGETPALFTGLGIGFCGYCGCPLVSQNGRRKNKDGEYEQRRLVCTSSKSGKKCWKSSTSVLPVEHALMAYCADQFNLSGLLESPDDTPLVQSIAEARDRIIKLETQIAKIVEAMLESDDAPASFARKARELEETLKTEKAGYAQLETQLSVIQHKAPSTADVWADLVQGVQDMDYESRMSARSLIADTFSRISVYMGGWFSGPPVVNTANPLGSDKYIGLALESKSGVTRLITINRLTGELSKADDYSPEVNPALFAKPAV